MTWLRRLLILAGLVLVLAVANMFILERQRVVDSARLVLLELRPVDPRSLMQGDFMLLDFADAVTRLPEDMAPPEAGVAILRLDPAGIATLVRIDDGTPPAPDEIRLRFAGRRSDGRFDFGTDAFFFQEGEADLYAAARYGMFRVDETGKSVLVGLADETTKPLGRSDE
jgi:uncharacterized membrane-anchored protein